ncbi:hypothetical protein SUGI_0679890 [Cryptomeria japonica]|nr:hypothetical protein SUGI_0679890 [Cryptomeria japonica]
MYGCLRMNYQPSDFFWICVCGFFSYAPVIEHLLFAFYIKMLAQVFCRGFERLKFGLLFNPSLHAHDFLSADPLDVHFQTRIQYKQTNSVMLKINSTTNAGHSEVFFWRNMGFSIRDMMSLCY